MSVELFMKRKTSDYIWRKTNEKFHFDCINYQKWLLEAELLFWIVFLKGEMEPDVFFNLKKGETVNSTIYDNQILLESLQQFWKNHLKIF